MPNTNLAHTLEHLMCQALSQRKQLTIQLSVSLEGENIKSPQQHHFKEIDEIFLKDIANQP